MNETEHAALEFELLRRRVPWVRAAHALVVTKMADAAAHAERALTATLLATPDGRPTLRRAARSRSFRTALKRLDELDAALTGPRTNSLTGLLRDARETFYRDAFELWKPHLDPALHYADRGPTQEGAARARGFLVFGLDLYQDLAGPLDDARRSLSGAIATAGRRAAAGRQGAALLALWQRNSTSLLQARVSTVLAVNQRALFWEIGHDLAKPGPHTPAGRGSSTA
jgi:hypothetical protein